MKNSEIPKLWKENIPAKNYTNTFHTDGYDLYSYNKLIGTTHNGLKLLYNYTSSSGCFISQTTSTHVGMARDYCDQLVHPSELW